MIPGLDFHHHGLAVRSDGPALTFLGALGYAAGEMIHDPVQDIRLRLCVHPSLPAVEIVMPGNAEGPLHNILERSKSLLYHTCYEIDDRDAVLDELEAKGVRLFEVLKPTPALLFGNRAVSFHTVLGYGLIELLDRH